MKVLLGLFCLLFPCNSLLADVGPVPGTHRIAPVFDNADLVCNCVVQSVSVASERQLVRQGRPVRQRRMKASLVIKAVYKADPSSETNVNVEFDQEIPSVSAGPLLFNGETALLFLKRLTPSVYVIADRYVGATPFSAIPSQPGAPSLQQLQSALTAILRVSNQKDQVRALRLLEGMDELGPETLAEAMSLSASSDAEIALSAIAVLIKGKSESALDRLTQFLTSYADPRTPVAMLSVGSELSRAADPRQLPNIEALAASKFLSIKFGALDAIRRIGSPHSASTLIELLSDSDDNVRFEAVKTLAEIFGKNGDYNPPLYLFDRNPDFYVRLWKTWWAEKGQLTSK